jgi:ubiquinone/menaquinone biosynthesis C-methylase UbiE
MKNKKFFYLQYNLINWKNQEKTKINDTINRYIINNILNKYSGKDISIFDIGFGVGYFIQTFLRLTKKHFKHILIEGCEPSRVNYAYFQKKLKKYFFPHLRTRFVKQTFQQVKTKNKFDYITAIYVFPHFLLQDLELITKKIYRYLKPGGRFMLVLANERYIKRVLKTEKRNLFIEENVFTFNGKKYHELLHYSDIPKIGRIIDFNRDEAYYQELFKKNGFRLEKKKILNDNGFICTLFLFRK